tara:strand:- start:625 stop:813 length:189 start_codon:yes stop_codon:yes gene_type:complete
MKPSIISKYYDLRYNYHRYYISPVEFKKILLEKEEVLEYRAVDTVSISREAKIKYENVYKPN